MKLVPSLAVALATVLLQGCGVLSLPLSSGTPRAMNGTFTTGQEGHGGDVIAADWAQFAHKQLADAEWEATYRPEDILMSEDDIQTWRERLSVFPVHSGDVNDVRGLVELRKVKSHAVIMVNRGLMKFALADDVFSSLQIFSPKTFEVQTPRSWQFHDTYLGYDPLKDKLEAVTAEAFRIRARQATDQLRRCGTVVMSPPRQSNIDFTTLSSIERLIETVPIRGTTDKLIDLITGLEVDAITIQHQDKSYELLFSLTRIEPWMLNTVGFMSLAYHEMRHMLNSSALSDERYRYSRWISNNRCY